MEFESITDATVSIDEAIAERERIRSEGKLLCLRMDVSTFFMRGMQTVSLMPQNLETTYGLQ